MSLYKSHQIFENKLLRRLTFSWKQMKNIIDNKVKQIECYPLS